MTETEFFALDSKAGRRHALCNLLGLIKFWEARDEEVEESEHAADEAVSGGNDDNFNSDDLVGNGGDSEMKADSHNDEDSSPKVRKRKRHSS